MLVVTQMDYFPPFCVQNNNLSTLLLLSGSYFIKCSIVFHSYIQPFSLESFDIYLQAGKQKLDQMLQCLSFLGESKAYSSCCPFHKVRAALRSMLIRRTLQKPSLDFYGILVSSSIISC